MADSLKGCESSTALIHGGNYLHGRTGSGHLVRNRFKSILVEDDRYLFQLLQYVPNNPVRAELARAAEDWKWSGFRATAGLEYPRGFHRPSVALAYFVTDPQKAKDLYRHHVAAGADVDGPVPWSDQGGGDA
jgi:hypothetical protein